MLVRSPLNLKFLKLRQNQATVPDGRSVLDIVLVTTQTYSKENYEEVRPVEKDHREMMDEFLRPELSWNQAPTNPQKPKLRPSAKSKG